MSNILRNICGGLIDVRIKRGECNTGVVMTARQNPRQRIVSTSWENWRGSVGAGGSGSARRRYVGSGVPLGGRDLDGFLAGL